MGHDISTCQMQYDANNKETNQKDPCFIYSGGNGPRKCRKHKSIFGSLSQMIYDGIHMSAMFALRLIGPLASRGEIFTFVHKR